MTFESYSETVKDRMATLKQAMASGNVERIRMAAMRLSNGLDDLTRVVDGIASEAFAAECAAYDAAYDHGVAFPWVGAEGEA